MEGSLTEKDRHAFAVNAQLNLKQASDCLRAAEKNFEIRRVQNVNEPFLLRRIRRHVRLQRP